MITPESTLEDICFAVSNALECRGMPAVLCGGSAATIYAPEAYMSDDADFVLTNDDPLDEVAEALSAVGFHRQGRSRIFTHPNTRFTVDFPKGPLAVGADYVRETHLLERGNLQLRIVTRTDCVRDRLAHYYHWNDFTALNAAVAVAAQCPSDIDMNAIDEWTKREDPKLDDKFKEFERRLRAVTARRGTRPEMRGPADAT